MALKIVKSSSLATDRNQLINLGHRAYATGDLASAAAHFLSALEQNDQDAELFVQLGVVLFQDQKFDKAVIALRQALELDPYRVDGLNAFGVVMYQLEWYAAAEAFFRRVLELDPLHSAAKSSLVNAMRMVRETGDAIDPGLDYLVKLTKPVEPTLSLCMIVKNEERFLDECLKSVQGVVDEIVLVDTGSTDGTLTIAERHGAKVIHFPWTGDFSAARNVSLEHATGDWILVLDADERLDEAAKQKLKPLLRQKDAAGFSLIIENYLGDREVESSQVALLLRLFRNQPDIRYEGIIHEQVSPSVGRTGLKTYNCEAKILHYGYLQECMDERGKNQRNLELLERQHAEQSDNPYVYFQLGQTHKLMGEVEQAEKHYVKALALLKEGQAPRDLPYYANLYYCLGDLNRRSKNFEQALIYLKEGEALFPTYADIVFTRGLVHVDQEQWQEAIPCFERCQTLAGVIHAGGTDPTVTTHKSLTALGICHSNIGNTMKAISFLKRAVAGHPNPDAELHTNLGVLYAQNEETAKALEQFVAALERDPRDLRAWLNLASLSYRSGHFQESVDAFDKALEIDPRLPNTLIPRAEALMKLGRLTEAESSLRLALETQPDSRPALLNLSLVHLLESRHAEGQAIWAVLPGDAEAEALALLTQALRGEAPAKNRSANSEVSRTWVAVLDLAIAADRQEWIRGLLDRLDSLTELVPGLDYAFGQAFHKRKQYQAALDLYLRAQQKAPLDPAPYIAMGEICQTTGNPEDAQIMFLKASELAPEANYPKRQLLKLGASR